MKIKNHKLVLDNGDPVKFTKSPNSGGSYKDLKYIVWHYTAGGSLAGAVRTLTKPTTKASAHFVVGRDGEIAQLVPCNIKAWHAGTSKWKDLVGLNSYSIGIEIVNWGPLEQNQAGQWVSWAGQVIPPDQVVVAAHPNGGKEKGWQTYTQKQLEVVEDLSEALIKQYKLEDAITHEMIAPKRKTDTGPAFPYTQMRGRLFGRKEEDDESAEYYSNDYDCRFTLF